MNHNDHKLYTTVIIFVLMVVGVLIAGQFDQVSHDALNTAMLLVNSLLLLIMMGMMFRMKDKQSGKKVVK